MSHHHHHCHGHDHHHESCCGDDHCCYCGDESCEHGHHHHHEKGEFAHELLELADDAWMEVLREKIKEQIVKSHSEHLDKLAKLVSDSNNEKWKLKMAKEKGISNFKDQIEQFFFQGK